MAEKQKTSLGPVGEALKGNLRRIREAQRLTYVELSDRLSDVGRPIPVLGLRRIERGERRVDIDDLVALAVVLATSPVDLLVPGEAPDDEEYGITPEVTSTAAVARDWIAGVDFLSPPQTPVDLAKAIQAMPRERAQMLAGKWSATTLEDQARVVARVQGISEDEALREVNRRAGTEREGGDE